MNIEQAREIDLEAFIRQLGHPVVPKGNAYEAWFLSPFRSEKTPSFKVDRRTNRWKDFAEAYPAGDIINFVQHYASRQGWGNWDTSRVLKELDRLAGGLHVPAFRPYQQVRSARSSALTPRYEIKRVDRIRSGKLLGYLRSRKIPAQVASTYLEELHLLDTKTRKPLFGLGWKNESGGFEMRNPFFKTCVGAKAISVVEVQQEARPGMALFEGMFDFLSYLRLSRSEPVATAVILNSTAMYKQAIAYCEAHHISGTPLLGLLQNDRPGLETAGKLKEALPALELQNHKYLAYGDVNDYLVGKKLEPCAQEAAAALLWERFSRSR